MLWVLEPRDSSIYTCPHQQTGHTQGPFYGCGKVNVIDCGLPLFFSKVILNQKHFKSMT